ncbi:MAG TPA: hypothetical protein VFX70_02325 [Mycobacteriales bacterium]|nr:hypothetical protein [Mycobacteriales bacterium]
MRPGGTLVLDCAGLAGLASGDRVARAAARDIAARGGQVVVAATTLTEVLRGGPRDATVHRVLKGVTVEPVTAQVARTAGELLGATGLDGHRCALDALVAAIARDCPRPVLLLTSDMDDMSALTDQPEVPRHLRISVHRV